MNRQRRELNGPRTHCQGEGSSSGSNDVGSQLRDMRWQLRTRSIGHRQRHDEFAALTQHAMRLYVALMHLDQPLHKRQPNPQAALSTIQRPLSLCEEIEDTRQEFRCDTDARIPHAQHAIIALLDGQPNMAALLGILGGVLDWRRSSTALTIGASGLRSS